MFIMRIFVVTLLCALSYAQAGASTCHNFCPLADEICKELGYEDGTVDKMVECSDNVPCFAIVADGGVFGDSTSLKGCMNPPNSCESYSELAKTIGARVESCKLSGANTWCHNFCPLADEICQQLGYEDGTADKMVECSDNVPCFAIVADGGVFGDSTSLKGCMNPPNSCETYSEFAKTIGARVESCKLSEYGHNKLLKQAKSSSWIIGPKENLYCEACTELAETLESEGCDMACNAIPAPGNEICSWILDASGMCQEIINKITGGESPEQACTDIGFCGSDCECGVCTKDAAGPNGRCLGMPNDCGHEVDVDPSWARRDTLAIDEDKKNVGICFDGQCDGTPGNIGCCLTCF